MNRKDLRAWRAFMNRHGAKLSMADAREMVERHRKGRETRAEISRVSGIPDEYLLVEEGPDGGLLVSDKRNTQASDGKEPA